MKIIYLHQYFNTPYMKGGTRSFEMARRMVERGHEVHMITSRREASENLDSLKGWSYEAIDGIHVHWLIVPYNNKMSYVERIKAFLKFALKSGSKAIEIGGDVVFATSTPLTIAIPAVKAKRKLKVPMVFEVRDLWPELPIAMGALKSPVTKVLARRLEKYAYFNSDHVVGLSSGMSEGVCKAGYPKERVTTIPNSCDLAEFSVENVRGHNFRKQRSWLEDRPLILYAGTLGHINNVSWLVDLAKSTYALDRNIRFLVLGEGIEEGKVKSYAKEAGVYEMNFFMEPRVAKNEVPGALNAATMCASLFLPMKEMEANSANKFFDSLAAGRPLILNYGGWQKELIEENGCGLVVSHDDVDTGARELSRFINEHEKVLQAGENARNLAEQKFSRDALAGQLIKLLEDVYKNSRTKP